MKLLLGAVLLGSLSGTYNNCPQLVNKKITVVGIAVDDKDAAIVETDKDGVYIIDGLDEWGKEFWRKKVQVTGRLIIEIHKQQSTPGHAVQERVGKWQIIKNAKWKIIQ